MAGVYARVPARSASRSFTTTARRVGQRHPTTGEPACPLRRPAAIQKVARQDHEIDFLDQLGGANVSVSPAREELEAWVNTVLKQSGHHVLTVEEADIFEGVRRAFGIIAMATTSTSALEARKLGFLRGRDRISMNRDTLLADAKARVEQVIATTGEHLWVEAESQLDAVTALSGSGPAYVFYFIEAMQQAAVELGLTAEQGLELAKATFTGAAQLAAQSAEPVALLRERVTSKGGTTYAALTSMEESGVKAAIVTAVKAAAARSGERRP